MSYLQLSNSGGDFQTITSRDLGLILDRHQIITGSVRKFEEVQVPYKQEPVLFDTNTYEPATIQLDFIFESASVNRGIVGYTDGSPFFDDMIPVIKAWLRAGFITYGYRSFYCPIYDANNLFDKYTQVSSSSWGTFQTKGYLADPIEIERISNNYGLVTIKIKAFPYAESTTIDFPFTSITISNSPWRPLRDIVQDGYVEPIQHFIMKIPASFFSASTTYYFNFNGGRLYFKTPSSMTLPILLDTKIKKIITGTDVVNSSSLFTQWQGTRPVWDVPPIGSIGGSAGSTSYFTLINTTTGASVNYTGTYAAYLSRVL